MTDDKWHGTPGGYTNHRCRCEPCRNAWNTYFRGRRSRRADAPTDGDNTRHGRSSTYCNGCRCAECTKAHAAYKRSIYHLRRAHVKPDASQYPCDCCGRIVDKLSLDHDHATGEFRGWLCHGCNTGLGKLGDTIEGVDRALSYLKRTL